MYPTSPPSLPGFSGHSDINKALEISLDVKRISNQLKECQTLAQLYNQRERLFGAPVTQYDKVNTTFSSIFLLNV